jgi:zinc protease
MQVVYRVPQASAAAFFPLLVLDSLLSGPSGLNLFGGGGVSNKTSRLYKSLVEKNEVAVDVNGGLPATIDPFLLSFHLVVHPQKTAREALSVLDEEIKHKQDTLCTDEEIARAAKQTRALFAYGGESITNQAFWMGFSEMFANYGWVTRYIDRVAEVTPDDIQQAAQNYLVPKNRVVGTYLPVNGNITS